MSQQNSRFARGWVSVAVLVVLCAMAGPAAAGASTVSVEPYRERPDTDPDDGFGGCGRYAQCPADMLVFTAAAGEVNDVTITRDTVGDRRFRFLLRDAGARVEPGAGCERVDELTTACTAGIVGPVQLGDGDDRIASSGPGGFVSGGDGEDLLSVRFGGVVSGGDGDDVLIGYAGEGAGGDDLLIVSFGQGDAGNDILRCSSAAWGDVSGCNVKGGPGDDLLTGGTSIDQLFGDGGRDLLNGRGGDDNLAGGLGNDRLLGGAGADVLGGGPGADRLEAREDRSVGERPEKDRVNCGAGRRDRATVDRRDRVRRCERVTPRRDRAR